MLKFQRGHPGQYNFYISPKCVKPAITTMEDPGAITPVLLTVCGAIQGVLVSQSQNN